MRFFLSSTAYDLYDFRALVVDELQRMGHEVLHHEHPTFSALAPMHSHDSCLQAISKCDAIICLLDRRYGGRYAGGGQPYIVDLDVVVRTPMGKVPVHVDKGELSITWCELLAAFHLKKPAVTFARKRLMDEKEARRINQVYAGFKPAYAEDNRLFDLIDWVTKQKVHNWISPFDSIVDFRTKLLGWISSLREEMVTEQVEGRDDADKMASVPNVCVIVEGHQDREFVRFLIRKLGIQSFFVVSVAGAKSNVLNQPFSEAAYLKENFDRIIVMVDADTTDKDVIVKFQEEYSAAIEQSNVGCCTLVQAEPQLEGWLMAGLKMGEWFSGKYGAQGVDGTDVKAFTMWLRRQSKDFFVDMLNAAYDLESAVSKSPSLASLVQALECSDRNTHPACK